MLLWSVLSRVSRQRRIARTDRRSSGDCLEVLSSGRQVTSPSSIGQHRVGPGENFPTDSHCAEHEQSNLEVNDAFLIKTMRTNIAVTMLRSAIIANNKHRYRRQEHQTKVCKVAAEETPLVEEEEAKAAGGDQPI